MTSDELLDFIKCFKGHWTFTMESGKEVSEEQVIKALEQEPKTGHWIFQKIKYGEHLAPMRLWCSNCNSAFDLCCNQIRRYNKATGDDDMWIYCPWCGAKMSEGGER